MNFQEAKELLDKMKSQGPGWTRLFRGISAQDFMIVENLIDQATKAAPSTKITDMEPYVNRVSKMLSDVLYERCDDPNPQNR